MLSGDSLLPRGPVVVCAGIGNPESFFASVRALGYDVKAEYPFPDHHHFTEQDVALMLDEYPEAALVCTEKDAVKLERMKSNLLLRCAVLAVRLKMTPRDTFAVTLVKMMQGQPVPT
jgi:tetraacyldisaccharide 4'-kinase